MTEPDLSYLLSKSDPAAYPPQAPEWPRQERRSAENRPAGSVASLIAELRHSQAELEAQNKMLRYSQAAAESASERFEALFASVPLALMVIDAHDIVVQANPMAHRSFQPSEGDRPLTALMPFVDPAHAPRVRHAFSLAAESGQAEATEVVLRIGEATQITGDLHIARIEAPQADAEAQYQFLCALVDQGPLLAERRALQQSTWALQQRNEQLYAGEKRLEAVINSALDAIICVDRHRRITVFNPTAAALFQCAAGDALGSPLERFLPKAAEALVFAPLTTQAMLGEMTARTASGRELAVEVSVSFEQHADGETTTVFARDLTARKRAEERRGELELQLRESHKMQAVGTMAGGIAHDFNNILGAILGNVELARADCPPDSPVQESLREIAKAGRRARDLVRQILTFSRNEPPRRTPVRLEAVLHDTERLLRVTLPPTVDLQVRAASTLPTMLADATQVEQAVLNLCTNAIQAMGGRRGHVAVHAQVAHPEARVRERLALPAGRYIAITVRDDGPGMDADTLARVFEPFFTTKPVGQGTGLGLAVVHGVMRAHGGAVDVRSTPGEGSCFTLYFPAADDDVQAPDFMASSPAPLSFEAPGEGPQRHVMYVDDDQALVFLVQRLLRRRGYKVSGFTDPRAALAALAEEPWTYDLLVTDYNMPGFSGLDLLREVQKLHPDLPVALASGYVTQEIEEAAMRAGARALVHKPNDVEELCATVQRLVRGDA
ncbi:MAG: hybrid sensor histidine kinase/response regulator [Acidovorax sp. SCN 68-22]|nr:MAG: hybrid sensor histidine kinase/response regulator [Acidovorax sp. SCN 68-22]